MKKIQFLTYLIPLIILFNYIAYSQNPDTIWTKIHSISPEGDIDEGNCVRQTADGGFIITGSCVPNGLESHIDLLLLKTDPSGNIVWTKSYGKDFIESAFSVEQTSDGGYIIGGRSVTGSYPLIEPPISDVWILKTDVNGDTLWTKTYGGEGNEYCTSIQQTSDLGYILTGTMNSEYCYPHYEVNEDYQSDSSRAWLIKIDANGDTLWTKTYFTKSHGNSVIPTSDDGYLICGWIFPDEQNNQSDILLIKINSFGDTLWTRIIGEDDYDIGLCVRETSDGYIISGQTKPVGQHYDALLIKTDLSGNVVWNKKYGGELSDVGFTVEVTDGGFFVTGVSNGTWWITAISDMWAFKTDWNGKIIWERIYDIRFTDIAFCGIQSADSGYVLTGMTSHGFGGDLWLTKINNEPTGIKDSKSSVYDYTLFQNYPNPFNPVTIIKYSLPVKSKVKLIIYNSLGEKVKQLVNEEKPIGTYTIEFDASNLPSGIYFYKLQTQNFTQTKKMILLR
jgi:hypothetical protein